MEPTTPQIIAYVVKTDREYTATQTDGSERSLHRGTPIYAGETLSSQNTGEIEIKLVGSEQIFTLTSPDTLLFDQSLLENGFVDEETQAEKEFVELALSGELTPEDIEKLEATAAGEEGGASSSESTDQFDQRSGEEVDVNAGLIPNFEVSDGFSLDLGGDASVPVANPDLNSIREDEVSVSGNVIDNPVDDNQDDFIGADSNDQPVTGVLAGDTNGSDVVGNVGSAVAGQFGSVTINADGSYVYSLDNGNPNVQGLDQGDALIDVFTYTITDGNGDTDTTTLTIVINGQSDVIVAPPPTTPAPDPTPQPDPDPEPEPDPDPTPVLNDEVESVMEGSLTITDLSENLNLLSNDNLNGNSGSITSFTYKDESGTIQTGTIGQAADTQYGNITLSANGAWRYTSDPTEFHGTLVDVINYTVTDSNGNSETAAFNILVTDDVPTATGDFNSLLEDTVSISGNVVENDRIGADFTPTPVTGIKAGLDFSTDAVGNVGNSVNGQYGSVVLNSDGSYTYTLDNSNETVQALALDEQLRDIFTYTITDTDGDTSTTTLVIDINGDNELSLVDDSASVVEGGITIDSSSENLNLLLNDTFTSFGGEISSFTFTNENGTEETGTVGLATNTQYGTVTINADGSWSFTSDASEQHGDIVDVISYTISDSNGNSAEAAFRIEVTDTVPSASADSNSITEEDSSISGNVFSNDSMSADTTATPVTGVKAGNDTASPAIGNVAIAVAGSYGAITVNADGTYSYALDNTNGAVQALNDGDTLNDIFTYSITDGDGDIATTTVNITINGKDEPPPPASNPGPDAVDDFGNIYDASEDEPGMILTGNVFDGAPSGAGKDDIGADGFSPPGPVTNVVSPFDADKSGINTTLQGQFGTITIDEHGNYTYILPHRLFGQLGTEDIETFTYTITDSSGDSDSATLTIGTDFPVYLNAEVGDTAVYEKGLVDGSFSHILHSGIYIDAPDGLVKLTIGDVVIDTTGWTVGDNQPLDITILTDKGTLKLTEFSMSTDIIIEYDYTLLENQDHKNGSVYDVIPVIAEDSNGDKSTDLGFVDSNIRIPILDDSPDANDDSIVFQTYYFEVDPSISGNVFTADKQPGEVADDIGADDENSPNYVSGIVDGNVFGPVDGNVGTTITGLHGELTIQANGDYTYSIPGQAGFEGALGDDVFTYTLKDSDNSTWTATLTISIPASKHNTNILKGETIDFSGLIDNEIDLREESDSFNNLTLSDVINLTDSTNNLTILGDASENLNFKSEPGAQWNKSDSTVDENGNTFDVYTNSGDSTVEVMIQQDINDQIV